jgi:hypothetical protein
MDADGHGRGERLDVSQPGAIVPHVIQQRTAKAALGMGRQSVWAVFEQQHAVVENLLRRQSESQVG